MRRAPSGRRPGASTAPSRRTRSRRPCRTTAARRASRSCAASHGCRRRRGRRRPSRRTRSRARRTAARRPRSGTSAPTTRGPARPGSRGSQAAVLDARAERRRARRRRSSAAAQVAEVAAGREPQLAAPPAMAPSRAAGRRIDEVDARGRPAPSRARRAASSVARVLVEHVDHRGALRGPSAISPPSRVAPRSGAQRRPTPRTPRAAGRAARRRRASGRRSRSSRARPGTLGPAAGVHEPLELAVRGRDRRRPARAGRCGASRRRCRAARAAGSRTGRAPPGTRRRSRRAGRACPACRAAPRQPVRAAREEVGVEELARPHHRLAGRPPRRCARAPSRRETCGGGGRGRSSRSSGGAQPGVVEPLEDGRHLGREVLAVHVVDRVGERAQHAERGGRAEARAVLDVALLGAEYQFMLGMRCGRDRRRSRSRRRTRASPTGTPRRSRRRRSRARISSFSAGARPVPTARSSIAGLARR